jgi:hypothetical protein
MMSIGDVTEANRRLLDQGLGLLRRLSDAQYAEPRGDWDPIGAQYRHVLEHYQCLLAGLPGAVLDYDARRRDRELERSRARARSATLDIQTALAAIAGRDGAEPVRIQVRTAADAQAPEWSASTLGRELQFLASHTVHHFALIKLLLRDEEIGLDPNFGVAASTIHARSA